MPCRGACLPPTPAEAAAGGCGVSGGGDWAHGARRPGRVVGRRVCAAPLRGGPVEAGWLQCTAAWRRIKEASLVLTVFGPPRSVAAQQDDDLFFDGARSRQCGGGPVTAGRPQLAAQPTAAQGWLGRLMGGLQAAPVGANMQSPCVELLQSVIKCTSYHVCRGTTGTWRQHGCCHIAAVLVACP